MKTCDHVVFILCFGDINSALGLLYTSAHLATNKNKNTAEKPIEQMETTTAMEMKRSTVQELVFDTDACCFNWLNKERQIYVKREGDSTFQA